MPASTILDHVTIVTDDFEASRAVYDALLVGLGLAASVDYEDPEGEDGDPGTVAALGYAAPGSPVLLWLVAGAVATSGAHLALSVTEPAMVEAVHRAAVAAGIRIVQPPRGWEQAQLGYFGTQFADPAGNLIEVVLRRSAAGAPQGPGAH